MLYTNDLKPGDIIFFMGNGGCTSFGQKIMKKIHPARLSRSNQIFSIADPDYWHTTMVLGNSGGELVMLNTKINWDRDGYEESRQISIAYLRRLSEVRRFFNGKILRVYRCRDERKAKQPAVIALRWLRGTGIYHVNRMKALRTIWHSSHYGFFAKRKARFFHRESDSDHIRREYFDCFSWREDPEARTSHSTRFVISTWQAALGADESATYMARDARFTSPMVLEAYLRSNLRWDIFDEVCIGSEPRLRLLNSEEFTVTNANYDPDPASDGESTEV